VARCGKRRQARAKFPDRVEEPSAKGDRFFDLLVAPSKASGSRIIPKPLLARLGLNDIGALAAESFVASQHVGYFGAVTPFEENRQRNAVLDRLVGALTDMRKHRMGRVAK